MKVHTTVEVGEMAEITGTLHLAALDDNEAVFSTRFILQSNSVKSTTVDRHWWETNGKPLKVDVEVKISDG
jgi:hypothetical protein